MTELASKRKKYVREMTATWWKQLDFYKLYMVREATAVPTVWFCLVLLYGIICAASENGIATSFVPFLQNPLVVILNIISLGALVYHAITLFTMTGEVMSGVVGVKSSLITTAFRALCIALSIFTLILAFI